MDKITTEDLWSFYHIKSIIDNNSVAAAVIKKFEILTNIKFTFENNDYLVNEPEIILSQHTNELFSIRDEFVYTSPYISDFFWLLAMHNYKLKHEIKNAINALAKLENPCQNKSTILKLLASPVIDDISFNGADKFTILSEIYGSFSFILATSYFKDNSYVLDYLSRRELANLCHIHTEKLSKLFPEYKSITALCTNYFLNYYYHSYSYNPEDSKVIDLCNKFVMDLDDYKLVFEPRDVSVIDNHNIEDYYNEVLKYSNQPSSRSMIFKIALYNHLKNLSEEENELIKSYKKCK